MDINLSSPAIMEGTVMHRRLFPKINGFTYGIYYLSVPLSALETLPIPRNRFAPLSFYDRDHGARDGERLELWARNILRQYKIDTADGFITLICMPRIFGYVFNPVSFWLCNDQAGQLRAVIAEVNNTFGETHSYLCVKEDQSVITQADTLTAKKIFHVSPFLEREGGYIFRFFIQPEKAGFWIDFYDTHGQKKLVTSLIGRLTPMTKASLRSAFWRYPLVTLKAILLIHWQALKLIAKGIHHIQKPQQLRERLSRTENLTGN